MLASNTRAYPSETPWVGFLDLPANIRQAKNVFFPGQTLLINKEKIVYIDKSSLSY
jgi:hypothetical protein